MTTTSAKPCIGGGDTRARWARASAVVRAGLLLAMVGLLGCGDAGAEACQDLVKTIADRAGDCGFDRDDFERSFEARLTEGRGCEDIIRVRDEDAFYEVCIPFFENLECGPFLNGSFEPPPECERQLQYIE